MYAPMNVIPDGQFVEKEYGKTFEFHIGVEVHGAPDWGKKIGATHTIYVGPDKMISTRLAKVKKTVVYVAVDEDDEGNAVWEKWMIKDCRIFKKQVDSFVKECYSSYIR